MEENNSQTDPLVITDQKAPEMQIPEKKLPWTMILAMMALGVFVGTAGYFWYRHNQEQSRLAIWENQTRDKAGEEEKMATSGGEFDKNAGDPALAANLITPTVTAEPTAKPTNTPALGTDKNREIYLTATAGSEGVNLKWTVTGIDTNLGFKIIKGENINPVYPGNDFIYLTEPAIRQYTWNIKDGKTYHFRVCKYLGGECGIYSNDVSAKAPEGNSAESSQSKVSSILLKGDGGGQVSWTVNGTSAMGFKVVWSKNSLPTYPSRNDQDSYHYYSEPDRRNDEVNAFSGSGTYFVRVCEYLGGECGTYSNQIEVGL